MNPEDVEAITAPITDAIRAAVNDEGNRILARIREAQASWRRHPDDPATGMVVAALDVLSCCITHRGVTREQALAEAAMQIAALKSSSLPNETIDAHISAMKPSGNARPA